MKKINWVSVGYVKRSRNRLNALEQLKLPLMPSELGKEMNISLTHASKIIRELNSKKLIKCLNEELKQGRIYQLTKAGLEVLVVLSKKNITE